MMGARGPPGPPGPPVSSTANLNYGVIWSNLNQSPVTSKCKSAIAVLSIQRLILVSLIIQQGAQGHTGHPGEPGEPGQSVRLSSKIFPVLSNYHVITELHHLKSICHLWGLKCSGFLSQGPRWSSWPPWTCWQSWRWRTCSFVSLQALFKGCFCLQVL